MANHTQQRHAGKGGAGVSKPDVCGYEGCVLDAWHDGEHSQRGSKPRGVAIFKHWLYTMCGAAGGCDMCGLMPFLGGSFGFYVDSDRNGWILCGDCIDELGGTKIASQ
jgi:hypothetical protein